MRTTTAVAASGMKGRTTRTCTAQGGRSLSLSGNTQLSVGGT